MSDNNWSSFTKRISINASPARIFNSWQSQEQIESWFLSSAVFTTAQGKIRPSSSQIQEGDTYQWMWYGSDNVANGEVLEVNGQNKLRFTFLDCEVSVFIKEEEGETLVELMQSKISLDETSKKNTYLFDGKPEALLLAFDKLLIAVIDWDPCSVGATKKAIVFAKEKAWLIKMD